MNYKIQTIPHVAQRYETVGDYWLKHPQEIEIRISDMIQTIPHEDPLKVSIEQVQLAERYELLITIHEMIEALLCRQASISFEDIDRFDTEFTGEGEPGDSPEAPYHTQHVVAMEVEKFIASLLRVDWDTYEKAVDSLFNKDEQVVQSEHN